MMCMRERAFQTSHLCCSCEDRRAFSCISGPWMFLSDSRSRKCQLPISGQDWTASRKWAGLSGCLIYCVTLIKAENRSLPDCDGAFAHFSVWMCYSLFYDLMRAFIKQVMWTLRGLTRSFTVICFVSAARRLCIPPHTWSRASGETFTHLYYWKYHIWVYHIVRKNRKIWMCSRCWYFRRL